MVRLSSIVSAVVAVFTASVTTQSILCEYFGGSPLQCSICGYNPRSPVYCVAYNATFDDMTAGQDMGTYKNTKWPGFAVLSVSPLAAAPLLGNALMKPSSSPNWATVPPNTLATMQFGFEGGSDPVATNGQLPSGSLHSFNYACATAALVPTACTITVAGSCMAQGSIDMIAGPFTPLEYEINYDPNAGTNQNGMAFQPMDFSSIGVDQGMATPQKCSNYSFSAVGTGLAGALTPVTLMLDNIIYNTFSKGLNYA